MRHLCFAILLVTTAAGTGSWAQQTPTSNRLTLQQCIDLAWQNNIQVRQGQLSVTNNDLQLKQSRLNQLPSLNFQGNQSLSGGRSINPQSNQFVQRTINSSSFQLNGSATLYNGLVLRNTIKQNDLTLQASEEELKATRNNVALTVAQNYLNTLTGAEQLEIARQQTNVTRAQLERMQKLVAAGSAPEANLYELRATLANNELDIVNAQNNYDLARVALMQAMNVPIDQNIDVVPVSVNDPTVQEYGTPVGGIYETAAANLPEIKGADLRVQSAAMGVQVAKGNLYPSLSLNGNLSSLYSSAAKQQVANGIISQQVIGFVTTPDGSQQPVYTNIPGYDIANYSYGEQLKNNFNRSISLFLRVPIFQGNLSRNRVTTAKIQQQNAELTAQSTRLQLRQQIESAYTNMRAAANRFRATQVQVASLEKAFEMAESRLNAGAINATDYTIAKANLDRARSQLVQAKYDYVFRTKILDYYQNKPLALE